MAETPKPRPRPSAKSVPLPRLRGEQMWDDSYLGLVRGTPAYENRPNPKTGMTPDEKRQFDALSKEIDAAVAARQAATGAASPMSGRVIPTGPQPGKAGLGELPSRFTDEDHYPAPSPGGVIMPGNQPRPLGGPPLALGGPPRLPAQRV